MTEAFTIGVTGAGGYIGSRVLYELQDAHPEWDIVAIDNFYHGDVKAVGDVTVEHLDIRSTERLAATFDAVDVIMHLAAISGVDDCEANPDLTYEVNAEATSQIAWLCRQTETALVFPASMAIYGDPESFPITTEQPRDPLNWYGRSKVLGEQAIATLADGGFPAHVLIKSNLYGDHEIDGRRVSKGTVINFFIDRALAEEPITVYEPGSQSRNFIHVIDTARAYVRSAERLKTQLADGETGVDTYAIASDEDPSVETLAHQVQSAAQKHGLEPPVERVENPRGGETMVEEFGVDTTRTADELGWQPDHDVTSTIETQLEARLRE